MEDHDIKCLPSPNEAIFAELRQINDEVPDLVPFVDTLKEDGRHAVHVCIWTTRNDSFMGLDSDKSESLDARATILMQMRFDGHLGFPGGLVDERLTGLEPEEGGRKIVEALRRELTEEINFDIATHIVTENDYLFSTRCTNLIRSPKPLFLHFYAHKVTELQILEIERRSLLSREHGREVMGNIRVPLYTMHDKFRGFPAFLKNQFIGTAKWELLFCLLYFDIFSIPEVIMAVASHTPQPLQI